MLRGWSGLGPRYSSAGTVPEDWRDGGADDSDGCLAEREGLSWCLLAGRAAAALASAADLHLLRRSWDRWTAFRAPRALPPLHTPPPPTPIEPVEVRVPVEVQVPVEVRVPVEVPVEVRVPVITAGLVEAVAAGGYRGTCLAEEELERTALAEAMRMDGCWIERTASLAGRLLRQSGDLEAARADVSRLQAELSAALLSASREREAAAGAVRRAASAEAGAEEYRRQLRDVESSAEDVRRTAADADREAKRAVTDLDRVRTAAAEALRKALDVAATTAETPAHVPSAPAERSVPPPVRGPPLPAPTPAAVAADLHQRDPRDVALLLELHKDRVHRAGSLDDLAGVIAGRRQDAPSRARRSSVCVSADGYSSAESGEDVADAGGARPPLPDWAVPSRPRQHLRTVRSRGASAPSRCSWADLAVPAR